MEVIGAMLQPCPHCQEPIEPSALFCPSCGGHQKKANDPLVDRLIGRYRILERVGAGGCSTVYKALHLDSGNFFAFKILRPQFHRNHEMVERFRREAMVLAKVKHENIVDIADFGWSQGLGFYIVMEWLDGPTVKEYIHHHGAFTLPEVLYFFAQLMDALDTAHQAEVIHRDLKLDNLMLVEGSFGRPLLKILDFGVAHIKNDQLGKLTSTGLLVGTPRYMAPEQVRHDVEGITNRTDLYSCGLMLIEMLTGRPAYDKESVQELLYCQVDDTPPALKELAPDLKFGDMLQEVVYRSVAKLQEERFPSAFEFFSALEQAMRESDVSLPSTLSLKGFVTAQTTRSIHPISLAAKVELDAPQSVVSVRDFEQIFSSPSLDDLPALGAQIDESLPPPPVFEQEAPSTLGERQIQELAPGPEEVDLNEQKTEEWHEEPVPVIGVSSEHLPSFDGEQTPEELWDISVMHPGPAKPEDMEWDRDTSFDPMKVSKGPAPGPTVLPGALIRELEGSMTNVSKDETVRVKPVARRDPTLRAPSASLSDFFPTNTVPKDNTPFPRHNWLGEEPVQDPSLVEEVMDLQEADVVNDPSMLLHKSDLNPAPKSDKLPGEANVPQLDSDKDLDTEDVEVAVVEKTAKTQTPMPRSLESSLNSEAQGCTKSEATPQPPFANESLPPTPTDPINSNSIPTFSEQTSPSRVYQAKVSPSQQQDLSSTQEEPDFPMESWMDWEDAKLTPPKRRVQKSWTLWVVFGVVVLIVVILGLARL